MLRSGSRGAGTFALLVAVALAQFGAGAHAQSQKDDEKEPVNQRELEMKACGPKDAKSSADTDKKNHPTPAAPADMAMVYVVRPTMMGNKIQTKLGVDGKWLGVNRGNNYFFFTLAPGEHYLCSQAENRSVIAMNVEAGTTYYLQQKITMGFMKARNRLEVIDESEGKKAVAKTHLSIFGERE
jgi:hypothetical protein